MQIPPRPILSVEKFEQAIESAGLSDSDHELIDYIRYTGVFSQPSIVKDLRIKSKPPVLSILCEVCRKIGAHMPDHFDKVREWSMHINEHQVKWDGELICSLAWNKDGERLTPESGTALFHTFVVHKELFQGLNGSYSLLCAKQKRISNVIFN